MDAFRDAGRPARPVYLDTRALPPQAPIIVPRSADGDAEDAAWQQVADRTDQTDDWGDLPALAAFLGRVAIVSMLVAGLFGSALVAVVLLPAVINDLDGLAAIGMGVCILASVLFGAAAAWVWRGAGTEGRRD